jgi:Sec-independent protein secretion pathway component TatC
MFTVGLTYSYSVFFPIIFDFLATVTVETGVVPSYSISSWTLFIVLLSVSFGMAAQIPILIPVLIVYNVVSYNNVKNAWRYWVVVTVTLGAFLSPPDPISQMLWAIPLILLYLFSLLISKIVLKIGFGNVSNKNDSEKNNSDTDVNTNNDQSDYTGLGSDIEIPSLEEGLVDDYYMYASIVSKALRSNIIILLIIFIFSLLISFYLLFTLLTESALESFKISIQNEEILNIISLHPVELIMFQAKLSFVISFTTTLISSVVIIWPHLIKDKITDISTNKIVLYLLSVIIIFLTCIYLSYTYIIPDLVEILIADALRIDSIISYRINRFFWMLVKVSSIISMFITLYYAIVIGYLINIIKYDLLLSTWRYVVFIIIIASILITPSGILKAFMISVPVSVSYLISVGTIHLTRKNYR